MWDRTADGCYYVMRFPRLARYFLPTGNINSLPWPENYNAGHTLFSLIWYDPTVIPEAPAENRVLNRLDLDWIIARTGYSMDDLVVAMRSGGPTNHEHADRNSVILKYAGEVLLADAAFAVFGSVSAGLSASLVSAFLDGLTSEDAASDLAGPAGLDLTGLDSTGFNSVTFDSTDLLFAGLDSGVAATNPLC